MTRSLAALVGCLFLAGCASSSAVLPEPPEAPPRPIEVVERDDLGDPSSPRSDEQTRQSALRVFAAEQRTLLNGLEVDTRFVRTTTGIHDRVRAALVASDRDLSSIEADIVELGRDDSLSASGLRAQQDELKDRLRRLATRLSLMESAIRAR